MLIANLLDNESDLSKVNVSLVHEETFEKKNFLDAMQLD